MELLNSNGIRFTKRQRENIAKALFDISKLIIAMLVLGPMVSKEGIRPGLLVFGFIAFLLVFSFAIKVDKGE